MGHRGAAGHPAVVVELDGVGRRPSLGHRLLGHAPPDRERQRAQPAALTRRHGQRPAAHLRQQAGLAHCAQG